MSSSGVSNRPDALDDARSSDGRTSSIPNAEAVVRVWVSSGVAHAPRNDQPSIGRMPRGRSVPAGRTRLPRCTRRRAWGVDVVRCPGSPEGASTDEPPECGGCKKQARLVAALKAEEAGCPYRMDPTLSITSWSCCSRTAPCGRGSGVCHRPESGCDEWFEDEPESSRGQRIANAGPTAAASTLVEIRMNPLLEAAVGEAKTALS